MSIPETKRMKKTKKLLLVGFPSCSTILKNALFVYRFFTIKYLLCNSLGMTSIRGHSFSFPRINNLAYKKINIHPFTTKYCSRQSFWDHALAPKPFVHTVTHCYSLIFSLSPKINIHLNCIEFLSSFKYPLRYVDKKILDAPQQSGFLISFYLNNKQ